MTGRKRGFKQTEEWKNSMSIRNSNKNNPMYGRHHSEESKNKMRKKHNFSIEGRKRLSVYCKNRSFSDETKEKIRESSKNRKHSEETKKKMSEKQSGKNHPMYGKHHKEESKNKISQSISGDKNPNWCGGISFEPYCYRFNNILKDMVRKRDNYQCQYPGCLCTQLESLVLYSIKLIVHHIHYNKKDCYPDLISLCIKHNSIVNFNRDYYEKFFIEKLKERGLLCKK